MFDGSAFDEWLKKGPERNPSLYGGHTVSISVNTVSTQGNAVPVAKKAVPEPLGKQMFEDRLRFDQKQEIADADDDPFDGIEPQEEQ
jgi:hypothetical protein